MFGDIMHPGDREHGVTLSCPGAYPSVCPAQEVMGHGDNEMGAFSVIQQKYHKVNEWKRTPVGTLIVILLKLWREWILRAKRY
jgi:hypothetical protein